MGKDFKFSIILATYNVSSFLNEAIDSIINQSLDFKQNIQLILVDDLSSDDSYEIGEEYQEKYPDNIILLRNENKSNFLRNENKSDSINDNSSLLGSNSFLRYSNNVDSFLQNSYQNINLAKCRNIGLEYAEGEYISFMESKDKISSNALEMVLDAFNSHEDIDVVSICQKELENPDKSLPLYEKFDDKNKLVNLLKDYKFIQSSVSSSFFRHDSINGMKFDENLARGSDSLFINNLFLKNPNYLYLAKAIYYYRVRYFNSKNLIKAIDKRHFNDYLRDFSFNLIDSSLDIYENVPDFIQYLIAFELCEMLEVKELNPYLDKDEQKEFFDSFERLLTFIDEKNISKNSDIEGDDRNFLAYIKYNRDFHLSIDKKKRIYLKSKDYKINRLDSRKFYVDIIEKKNGFLYLSGQFTSQANCKSISAEAILKSGGKKQVYTAKDLEYKNTVREIRSILGIRWLFPHNFDFKIPIPKENYTVTLRIRFKENDNEIVFYPKIMLRKFCHISDLANYFVSENSIILFRDNKFHIVPYSYKFMLRLELSSTKNILKSDAPHKNYSIFIRLLRLFAYPFMKNRKIYLFADRPFQIDDNAMHLFKYAVKQDDDIEKYFIIEKGDNFDYMKQFSKNIVEFHSFKHRFLYLFAEKAISSQPSYDWFNPFKEDYNERLTNNLSNVRKYCIRHGITKDDLSSWYTKFYHNFSLFLTSSDYERDSIINGDYNYDEEVVPVLGLARYDTLEDKGHQKIILFMPSWRNYLNDKTFAKSDYFKRLNGFLSNRELLDKLKEEGYRIIFRPHFDLLPFLDLFDIDDLVEVNSTSSYQELFNNSSLLITDYSSVFFDFAYLKKPIIYYHEGNDYHYNEGYFDYETMGFGPVVKSEEELLNSINDYIDKECVMEDSYKKRVDDFFKYTDRNNCKRIYEWILEH